MDYSGYSELEFERHGRVLVVAFNRPEAMNAFTPHGHTELSTVFADIALDDETLAVVLTGRGRAFSSGADVKLIPDLSPYGLDVMFREARKIIIELLELPQPIISAVNGTAAGLCANLALFCDVVYAARSARFADTHVRIGVNAGDGGNIIWPFLIGPNRAKEYLMTGDLVPADEAERIGLVNRVFPDEELMPAALAFATRLAEGPTRAIRATKRSVNALLRDAVNIQLDASLAMERVAIGTNDHDEAVRAFAEKRKAEFTGT